MRKNWKWLVLLAVVAAVILRIKLAATPVELHAVTKTAVEEDGNRRQRFALVEPHGQARGTFHYARGAES